MTRIEQKVAAVICEQLFGPFDATELDSPSSVSAQSLSAARAALTVAATAIERRAGNPQYQKAWKAAAKLLKSQEVTQ